jgi:aspartate racemase
MTPVGSHDLLGVVGGLGPIASAEFVKTIYEPWLGRTEQETPRVLLYSDPTFPDRTQSLLNGSPEPLLNQLVETLTQLQRLGASRFVICCITIHHLLPQVPSEFRSRLVSLIDVIFHELDARRAPHLLLCTIGTRQLGIFQRHERWRQFADLFVMLDEADQQEVHRLIYELKSGANVQERIAFVEDLLVKYDVKSFIAGCTEIHLLAKHFNNQRDCCIDPLISIARELAKPRAASCASHAR